MPRNHHYDVSQVYWISVCKVVDWDLLSLITEIELKGSSDPVNKLASKLLQRRLRAEHLTSSV